MFIVSVLSFIAGIYFEAINTLSVKYIALLLVPLLFFPFFLMERYRRLCAIVLFCSFFLAGMIRIGFVINTHDNNEPYDEIQTFETLLTESGKNIKVLKIIKPDTYKSSYAIFRTDLDLDIGDSVIIYGGLKGLSATYKNPHIISWKWLRRLEGINFELKGDVLKIKKGNNPIDKIRRFIKEKIEFSRAKQKGIIKALMLGDRTSIDEETKTIFQRTGTSHILAISGLHVGIITSFFFFIIRWLFSKKRTFALSGRDKRYAAIITIIFPVVFMLLSGSSIPTVRATFMVCIFLLAIFFEKQRDLLHTIFLAALFILLVYPHSLFMPSFQLSFLSVIFIVLITHRFYPMIKTISKPIKWLSVTIITAFSAMVGTLPAVLYHFYGINLLSPLHNLVSIPLMCLISLPVILAGSILPYGEYLIGLAGRLIDFNIQLLKTLDFGYIYPMVRPGLFESLLFYAVIICLLFANRKIVCSILCFLVLPLTVVHGILEINKRFYNELCINFIDVGMGDAILVEAPKGKRILIDGGQRFNGDFDTGKYVVTPILLSKKILTIDYVINTHPHSDHLGGLIYILEHFNVKRFVTSGFFIQEPLFLDAIIMCRNKGIDIEIWHTGTEILLKDDFFITVFNPDRDYPAYNFNNTSLVLKLRYGKKSILLTGDMERDIEERLILNNMPLMADVLKVPHHGSNGASSLPFLLAVKPKIAILSVGMGIKGLPGKEALNRYKSLSIPVLSTLKNGFISVCTDGKKVSVKPYQTR
ncbi:MAG TPA: DNA internalization-related competence protein ComEC/Rec2 [Syntrophorhabdaceae bacterium]|nr:DNA internalization-related competence protein ComEC/Rec2 [Syntrophorhabdaceae bacterium]